MAAGPALGALGMTFTVMRAMQFVALVTIIGLTSNFVAETVTSNYATPSALIGTLVVSCISMVYIIITFILYWDSMLPLLVSTGADAVCLIAVIVVACVVGRPVSYLNCSAFPDQGNTATFITSVFYNINFKKSNTFVWVDATKASCLEVKAIWGLSIALCVLFSFSAVTTACLWKRMRTVNNPPKEQSYE